MNVCCARLIVIVFTGLQVASALTDQTEVGSNGTHPNSQAAVVEYVKVKNAPCLQPKVINGKPDDSDLVAAQKRWLAKNYPGYRLVRQQHILTLAPELRPSGHEADPPTNQDSFEFESADGKPIAVCFGLIPPSVAGKVKK